MTPRNEHHQPRVSEEWDADVVVVGLGAWGAMTIWRLAHRGIDVLGIERYGLGHALGASHGGSRMYRLTCLEHERLVPVAHRALRLWRDLEAAAGRKLLHQVGGLLIGPPDGVIAGGTLEAARAHKIDIEILDAAGVSARFPGHQGLPPDHIGVWEPSAGILRPEEAVRAAAEVASGLGARIWSGVRVTAIKPIPGGMLVRTPARDVRVRRVVTAVGSWTSTFAPALPLETLRMPMTWFRPMEPTTDRFSLGRFPVFMRELADGAVLWGNGSESSHGVKLGLEAVGDTVRPMNPDHDDRAVTASDWTSVVERARTVLPGLAESPTKVAVCQLDRTPDGQFVVGHPGGDARLTVAGGCNAHGFKHAPGIGELIAQRVLGEAPYCSMSFLSPDRFTTQPSGDLT